MFSFHPQWTTYDNILEDSTGPSPLHRGKVRRHLSSQLSKALQLPLDPWQGKMVGFKQFLFHLSKARIDMDWSLYFSSRSMWKPPWKRGTCHQDWRCRRHNIFSTSSNVHGSYLWSIPQALPTPKESLESLAFWICPRNSHEQTLILTLW